MITALAPMFSRVTARAKTPRLRAMRKFAEDEITLTTGPHKGRKFDLSRAPFARLWFAEQDRGWRRFVATGPQQSGKTLCAFIIPTLYHLFEIGETVLCGLPSLDMVADKWGLDLMPAIAGTRYRELLPSGGPGSRGGETPSVTFKNGATLRFMTGGGSDKARSAFTSRVLVVTETDGMDEAGAASREADKITQLEGRTSAFGEQARCYMECTVSLEDGRTWREYVAGTKSRIGIRCPHCRDYVTPERPHLIGWQEAADVIAAGEGSHFACPKCGVSWSEEDRGAANHDCRLIHRGQDVDADGNVTGPMPRTDTLGFRWSAVNNLLVPTSVVGQREWKARRAPDEELAERELTQFVWAIPAKDRKQEVANLDATLITSTRTTTDVRGVVPADATGITVGVDVGGWLLHWTAIAWRPGATPHVIDYGRVEVPKEIMGQEQAVLNALRQMRDDICGEGWGGRTPALVFVDAGWLQDVTLNFCRESGAAFYATKGCGTGGSRRIVRQTGSKVVGLGDGWEMVNLPDGNRIIEVNADHWKTWLHARLKTPMGKPGAFTLFHYTDHMSFGKHLTAERQIQEFAKEKGLVTRWEAVSRNNHWLDSTALACVAGSAAGMKLLAVESPATPPPPQVEPEYDRRPSQNWATSFRGRY
jgi:phage terminase large subunit GpA-like protein